MPLSVRENLLSTAPLSLSDPSISKHQPLCPQRQHARGPGSLSMLQKQLWLRGCSFPAVPDLTGRSLKNM